MSAGTSADDAPLAQALDSFDQLALQRDRQRRRVTEEENAVRCLEELLTDKQREVAQLAREADSRAAELAALEQRVPALEDTHRSAKCSLQMLSQMRDLLSKQLDSEKGKTDEMLKTLDNQLEEAVARWKQYEAVYLTMPAYQRNMETIALTAEERELNERKEQLETELETRVSDRDFCVHLAECWTQVRLLEGAIAGGGAGVDGAGQTLDGESMNGACSQGFGTPRASPSPSPVSDMETSHEPEPAAKGAERVPDTAGSPVGRRSHAPEGPQPLPAERSVDRTWLRGDGAGASSEPCRDPDAAPGAPPEGPRMPSPPRQEVTSPGKIAPLARAGVQGSFQAGAIPQQYQHSPQREERLEPTQENTDDSRLLPAAQPGLKSQTEPSSQKLVWSSAVPRQEASSPRRPGSFLIQMPSLYRRDRSRAGETPRPLAGAQPAVPVPALPPPIHTQFQCRPLLPPPQQPSTSAQMMATAQEVEMMDLQETQQSPARPRPGDQAGDEDISSIPDGAGGRTSQRGGSPRGSSPTRRPAAPEERQTEATPPTASVAVERTSSPQKAPPPPPQKAPQMLGGPQYWMPMPPETPSAPQADERRSFVQRLRESPELARRSLALSRPTQPGRIAVAPTRPGPGHQFLQPAVPSGHWPASSPAPAAGSPQSIFDTPHRPVTEPASPQRPPVSSASRAPPQPAPSPTARPPPEAAPSEPATPTRPAAAAGDAPRTMAAIFASPETDAGQVDSGFSLFGGPARKEASPQPPPSSMSLFGAGDVGGDGDQGADDFSFSFFSGGSKGAEKDSSGDGGVFSFF